MTVTGTASCVVRRPPAEVAVFATDLGAVLPLVPGVERFARAEDDDRELWDVFLLVGTLHIGGRVQVSRPSDTEVHWDAVRGTDQSFDLRVDPHEDGSLLRMRLRIGLRGLLMARMAELAGHGVVVRHLEAAVQNIRHHLEHERPRTPAP